MMTSFLGIGCMSGSSLDGLDICLAEFTGDIETDFWGYRILKTVTLPYSQEWEDKIRGASKLPGEDLIKLDVEYGHYVGQVIREFIAEDDLKPDFIASHGHTVFHRPDLGYTYQIGDGETTSSYFDCPYVCNFRSKDVALGGQGAPLVPNGDKYLFSPYGICINLGGICNIGLKDQQGYDVSPCNYVMNKLARTYDPQYNYDVDGKIAARGSIIDEVLRKLEALPFYRKPPPKSLDTQWIEDEVLPILDTKKYSIPDLMKTFVEHITNRLVCACAESRKTIPDGVLSALVTGGGAFNKNLMDIFKQKLKGMKVELEQADEQTIAFKEALIFAFLGLRCILGQENVSKVITGSRSDSVSGSIHRPLTSNLGNIPSKFEKCYFEFKRLKAGAHKY